MNTETGNLLTFAADLTCDLLSLSKCLIVALINQVACVDKGMAPSDFCGDMSGLVNPDWGFTWIPIRHGLNAAR